MEKKISYSCDVSFTRRDDMEENFVLKSEKGYFDVGKDPYCGELEIIRTISFPSEGRWFLVEAGKYFLSSSTSLGITFCIDGEVKSFIFAENMGFDVPINRIIERVLRGTFDISYEELPNLIELLKSGFVPPER